MNTFWKIVLGAVVVLGCVGAGTFAGCIAGLMLSSGLPGSNENRMAAGAFGGMAIGALVGLVGGSLLARKVLNPPPRL